MEGQFKYHWRATFRALKEKLDLLKEKGPLPIHLFVMTDLPSSSWDAFKVFILRAEDKLVTETAKKLVSAGQNAKLFAAVPSRFCWDCWLNHYRKHRIDDEK